MDKDNKIDELLNTLNQYIIKKENEEFQNKNIKQNIPFLNNSHPHQNHCQCHLPYQNQLFYNNNQFCNKFHSNYNNLPLMSQMYYNNACVPSSYMNYLPCFMNDINNNNNNLIKNEIKELLLIKKFLNGEIVKNNNNKQYIYYLKEKEKEIEKEIIKNTENMFLNDEKNHYEQQRDELIQVQVNKNELNTMNNRERMMNLKIYNENDDKLNKINKIKSSPKQNVNVFKTNNITFKKECFSEKEKEDNLNELFDDSQKKLNTLNFNSNNNHLHNNNPHINNNEHPSNLQVNETSHVKKIHNFNTNNEKAVTISNAITNTNIVKQQGNKATGYRNNISNADDDEFDIKKLKDKSEPNMFKSLFQSANNDKYFNDINDKIDEEEDDEDLDVLFYSNKKEDIKLYSQSLFNKENDEYEGFKVISNKEIVIPKGIKEKSEQWLLNFEKEENGNLKGANKNKKEFKDSKIRHEEKRVKMNDSKNTHMSIDNQIKKEKSIQMKEEQIKNEIVNLIDFKRNYLFEEMERIDIVCDFCNKIKTIGEELENNICHICNNMKIVNMTNIELIFNNYIDKKILENSNKKEETKIVYKLNPSYLPYIPNNNSNTPYKFQENHLKYIFNFNIKTIFIISIWSLYLMIKYSSKPVLDFNISNVLDILELTSTREKSYISNIKSKSFFNRKANFIITSIDNNNNEKSLSGHKNQSISCYISISDGFDSIKAVVKENSYLNLIGNYVLAPGIKICIGSIVLYDNKTEDNEVILEISSNNISILSFDSPLGLVKNDKYMCKSISNTFLNEGPVPCMDVIVLEKSELLISDKESNVSLFLYDYEDFMIKESEALNERKENRSKDKHNKTNIVHSFTKSISKSKSKSVSKSKRYNKNESSSSSSSRSSSKSKSNRNNISVEKKKSKLSKEKVSQADEMDITYKNKKFWENSKSKHYQIKLTIVDTLNYYKWLGYNNKNDFINYMQGQSSTASLSIQSIEDEIDKRKRSPLKSNSNLKSKQKGIKMNCQYTTLNVYTLIVCNTNRGKLENIDNNSRLRISNINIYSTINKSYFYFKSTFKSNILNDNLSIPLKSELKMKFTMIYSNYNLVYLINNRILYDVINNEFKLEGVLLDVIINKTSDNKINQYLILYINTQDSYAIINISKVNTSVKETFSDFKLYLNKVIIIKNCNLTDQCFYYSQDRLYLLNIDKYPYDQLIEKGNFKNVVSSFETCSFSKVMSVSKSENDYKENVKNEILYRLIYKTVSGS